MLFSIVYLVIKLVIDFWFDMETNFLYLSYKAIVFIVWFKII